MIPILTPDEMTAVDTAAVAGGTSLETLIDRAGRAVALEALQMLGGTYGRRVTVVAGPGNNGADGRVAAKVLSQRGVVVRVVEPDCAELGVNDLVIDAAFGTGFRDEYLAPSVNGAAVLAVDIASGIDGTTGAQRGIAVQATRTITFGALKPGLVLGDGLAASGEVKVAEIGLDISAATCHLATDEDIRWWVPERKSNAHKWNSATWIIAGSRGLTGAARLAALGALRSSAGYVRLSTPGPGAGPEDPIEAIGFALPVEFWDRDVLYAQDRMSSIVIGPGLGRDDATKASVRTVVAGAECAVVVDADALWALGDRPQRFTSGRRGPTVLTPHAGEFIQLIGGDIGADRVAAVRDLAVQTNAVVLLKGPTTIVAAPDGRTRLITSGSRALASAGTGDVLAGVIGAFLARGADPFEAAAAAAHVHGRAGTELGDGLIASDLPRAIRWWLTRTTTEHLEIHS